jgi:hypothetical protein
MGMVPASAARFIPVSAYGVSKSGDFEKESAHRKLFAYIHLVRRYRNK